MVDITDVAIEIKEIHELIFAESFQYIDYTYKLDLFFKDLQEIISMFSFPADQFTFKDAPLIEVEIFPGQIKCSFFEKENKLTIRLPEGKRIKPLDIITLEFRWKMVLGRTITSDWLIFNKHECAFYTEAHIFSNGIPKADYYIKIPSVCNIKICRLKGYITQLDRFREELKNLDEEKKELISTNANSRENGSGILRKIMKLRTIAKLRTIKKKKTESRKKFVKQYSYKSINKNKPIFKEKDGNTHHFSCKDMDRNKFEAFQFFIYLNRFSKFWLTIPPFITFYVAFCFLFMILPPMNTISPINIIQSTLLPNIFISFTKIEALRNILLILAILIAVRNWLLYSIIELQQKNVELTYIVACTFLILMGFLIFTKL